MLAEREQDPESELIEICGYQLLVDRADIERIRASTWSIFWNQELPVFQTRVREGLRLIRMNLPRFLLRPLKGEFVVGREGRAEWDYRKSAFLVCDSMTRAARLGKRKHKTSSRFKGVSFSTKLQMWTASIRPSGKSIHLGTFNSEIEAARAYNQAALQYFGPLAFLNDVSEEHVRTTR